jgi:hypothetical protein
MNGRKAKELRRLARELALKEGIGNKLAYRFTGPFKKRIDVLDPKGKPTFDEIDGKQVKRQSEVIGYTATCMGLRGVYRTLKSAFKEARRQGDHSSPRDLFASQFSEAEVPQTCEMKEAA